MKQLLQFKTVFLMATSLFFGTKVSAQEPYAVLSDDNSKLTFYYDNNKESRNGMGVGPFWYDWSSGVDSEWYEQRGNITTVVFDETFADCTSITSTAYWFYECKKLEEVSGIRNLNTANVTDMEKMFLGCSSLVSLDVSNFNTANVTSMNQIFTLCRSLMSLDVSNFNTANVTDMNNMFTGCESLTSIDVRNFNTDNVTSMHGMFSGCSSLTSLDVNNFNTAKVTKMSEMFMSCISLTSLDVSNFNTENVKDMDQMFEGCMSLTSLDLSNFNTAKVTTMRDMFAVCDNLTSIDLSSFNTANVTNMSSMFNGCRSLTAIDLSTFDTSEVTDMSYMFRECSKLTTIYAGNDWSTKKVTSGNGMFEICSKRLIGGAGTVWIPKNSNHTYARIDGGESSPGYFTFKSSTPIEDIVINAIEEDKEVTYNTPELYENLSNNVVGNIYYNLNGTNGYDITENCIVINTATDMSKVIDSKPGSNDVQGHFTGIILEVNGEGLIEFDCQTLGTAVLNVKVGNAESQQYVKDERGKVQVMYDVTVPTYVYVFATENAAARAVLRANAATNSIKIWSLKVRPGYTDNVILTANSYSRSYGDENPTFDYTVSDGTILSGAPTLSCSATSSSPVGTYDIEITKGDVTNSNVTLVNGTLTIIKAPLKVGVKDAEREQGEENPQFELVYEGWKLQDTESVLLTKPVATTTATKDSPAGEYVITVSGGEAQNYELSYENGKLTVKASDGIESQMKAGKTFDIYDMCGRKVRHQATMFDDLPSGVYIIDGKKVVVRK